jgi:hypothetical protein
MLINSPIMNAHMILKINCLRKNRIANVTFVIFLACVKLLVRPQTRVSWKFATTNIATKRLIIERLCWLICGRCMMLNWMMVWSKWRWRLWLMVMMNRLDLNWLHFLCGRWRWSFCTWSWVVTSSNNDNASSIACVALGDSRDGFFLRRSWDFNQIRFTHLEFNVAVLWDENLRWSRALRTTAGCIRLYARLTTDNFWAFSFSRIWQMVATRDAFVFIGSLLRCDSNMFINWVLQLSWLERICRDNLYLT